MAAVRKRSRYERAREKRGRPRTKAPTAGWIIHELSRMTGVSVRTLRDWVTAGIITPIERRGTATRYARRELLRLLATMRARKETKLTLAVIKKKMDAFGDQDLESWLRGGPVPPLAAAALGFPSEAEAQAAAETARRDAATGWLERLESWRRVEVLPGLELLLGPNASPAALRAAQEIWAKYAG